MIIRCEGLSRIFTEGGKNLAVINELNWQFPEGKTIAIVGRSGVGKSTLLQLLCGLDQPTSGSVWYNNDNISLMTEDQRAALRMRSVGYVFQFHHLLPEFSAAENVAMPLALAADQGFSAENMKRAMQALQLVGLADRAEHRPKQLSGGEQQRVAVARAVVHNPEIVFADEPTGNLDTSSAELVGDLLYRLHHAVRCTVITVTHSRDLAQRMDIRLEMLPGGALKEI
jgi:lipoprotein-releasing system ATP-binding protein